MFIQKSRRYCETAQENNYTHTNTHESSNFRLCQRKKTLQTFCFLSFPSLWLACVDSLSLPFAMTFGEAEKNIYVHTSVSLLRLWYVSVVYLLTRFSSFRVRAFQACRAFSLFIIYFCGVVAWRFSIRLNDSNGNRGVLLRMIYEKLFMA